MKDLLRSKRRYNSDQVYSLRVYTQVPKEIKFTPFLLEKLAERYGQAICHSIETSLTLFLKLSEFLLEYSFALDELSFDSLSDELLHFALDLLKRGALQESLGNKREALLKYHHGSFVLDELNRELYHSLKFSTEDEDARQGEDCKYAFMLRVV